MQVYNLMSDRILLAPVPEYPIFSDREGDDANKEKEDAPYQDDLSLYKEDGSLEVYFSLTNSNCKSNDGLALETLSAIILPLIALL